MSVRVRALAIAVVLSVTTITAAFALSAGPQPGAAEAPAASPVEPPVPAEVRSALQDRRYDEAVRRLDRLIEEGKEGTDWLLYLKGLALSYGKRPADAVATLKALEERHPDSPWLHKARFARAEAHLSLRQYEEAESIYDAEAQRLMDSARKEALARPVIALADRLATPKDESQPDSPAPDYGRAYELYKAALECDIGRAVRDEVTFKMAETVRAAGNWQQAAGHLEEYLREFDPDWREARRGIESPGARVYEARLNLGLCYQQLGRQEDARRTYQDLVALADRKQPDDAEADSLRAEAMYRIAGTYDEGQPGQASQAVKALRDYVRRYPAGEHAVQAAFDVGTRYESLGQHADAAAAYQAFLAGTGYRAETDKAKERLLDLTMEAKFRLGQVFMAQKEYEEARKVWGDYIVNHPAGPQWSQCQQGIIEAEYRVGADLKAEKRYDETRKAWEGFLRSYPLDPRAREIMYDFGQMAFDAADQLKGPEADRKALYAEAVRAWERLVSKYRDTEESSHGQYMIGLAYETKLLDLPKAIGEYRKCTWGAYAPQAAQRIRQMTERQLTVVTQRTYRTGEQPRIKVQMRNIEKLTLSAYKLDLQDYFRKMHGITGVEGLDTLLIAPDRTWEVEARGYEKYRPIEQEVEIPMDAGEPGAFAVRVTGGQLQATTLIIRSDLDVIVKSSRKALLVFAEDMAAEQPWAGVTVVASDGQKVFFEGQTAADGVLYKTFDELKAAEQVSVLAFSDGHVASNALGIGGLAFSEGLSPRGYIYTDRPAYRPGQTVSIRAVIREVTAGSYAFEKGQVYTLEIVDSQGLVLATDRLPLSEFGTLHSGFELADLASVGTYTVRCHRPNGPTFSGTFEVQRYKLEPMELSFELERSIVFRGEPLKGKLIARYYYGEPLAGREIEYFLPDGRRYVAAADANGEVPFTYDTSPLLEEQQVVLTAGIVGENVRVQATAFVAVHEFSLAVSALRDVYMAREPFDVTVRAVDVLGKPVACAVALKALRRESQPDGTWAEVLAAEKPVATDGKTGDAVASFALEKGGQYVLRAEATDRFGNPIAAQAQAFISDEEDALKLRILADRQHLKVGETAAVTLHSRLKPALALLTFEGEEIIGYRTIRLAEGRNPLEISIVNGHFPNFALGVAAMVGNKFHAAAQSFTVERELRVAVRPDRESYEPGQKASVEILTTDQNDAPVSAELSLAMVDEALLGIFADRIAPIREFFEEGARRVAALATTTSCTFAYSPPTVPVPEALISEKERLERERQAAEGRELVEEEAAFVALGVAGGQAVSRARRAAAARDTGVPAAAQAAEELSLADEEALGQVAGRRALRRAEEKAAAAAPMPPAREAFPETAYWNPAVVTDKDGRATLTITMPGAITKWRLTARGATAATLVGQQTAAIATRQEFFVELKLPAIVTEGDSIRPLVRVHNLSDYAGPAEVEVRLTAAGEEKKLAERVSLEGRGIVERMFEGWKVPPADELVLQVEARAGAHADAVSRRVPIRPWGLGFSDSRSGVVEGQPTFWLELPPDRPYTRLAMSLLIDTDVEQVLIETALGRDYVILERLRPDGPIPHADAASRLLGVVSVMQYLQGIGRAESPDWRLLGDRAESLVAELLVSQHESGGWPWAGAQGPQPDPYTSSRAVWALTEAKRLGVAVPDDVLGRAVGYLKQAFSAAAQQDDELKSTLLHALALAGEADFGYANRLYRDRQRLSPAALAHTALTLAVLDRQPMAADVLDVLEAKRQAAGPRDGARWPADSNQPWMQSDDEMTALALLAYLHVRPDAPAAQEATQYLLAHRPWSPRRAVGPALAALSRWFGKEQPAESDYRLTVRVNEQEVETIGVRGAAPARRISVPPALIRSGKNRVDLALEGRGRPHFIAVLSGFSSDVKPPAQRPQRFSIRARYYEAVPPEYKGKPIPIGFSLVHGPNRWWRNQVSQLPVGKRTHVQVEVYRQGPSGEESAAARDYLVVREHLPAGVSIVEDSVRGSFDYYVLGDGELTIYAGSAQYSASFSYDLVGYAPGSYRILPTVVQSAYSPGLMVVGNPASMAVLDRSEKSSDPYEPTPDELYHLGKAYFDDGLYEQAGPLLEQLIEKWEANLHDEPYRETARMLLFVNIERGKPKEIVRYFEVLKEKYPTLVIPFDKVLAVAKAYRQLEEYERAMLVYKATVSASFVKDAHIAGVLQGQGRPLASVEFMKGLWQSYPDTPAVTDAYLALADMVYTLAPRASEVEEVKAAKLTHDELMLMSIRILVNYLTLYPEDPSADDAALNLVNAYLKLKDFKSTVSLCRALKGRFAESSFLDSFEYVEALAQWNLANYEEAIDLATKVAEKVYTLPDGTQKPSDNRDLAVYIVGQIWHARGRPAQAIEFYTKVKDKFADAAEAISYFERRDISLDEVATFEPGVEPSVTIKYRNIPDVHLLVYRVDLMTLYLTEKNLSRITKVNLAGISPALEPVTVHLGDGRDYAEKETKVALKVQDSGAYLVICRGGDLHASGMVLLTPVKLEVQEDPASGRVRVNAMDRKTGTYLKDVHVKVIGSQNRDFVAGETDLRGVFVADGIRGTATVIARDAAGQFAFYRGTEPLMAPPPRPVRGAKAEVEYMENVAGENARLQSGRAARQQELYQTQQKGVQVQSFW